MNSLRNQLKNIEANLEIAYDKLKQEASLANIDRVNQLRVDLRTVKSRINNYGKDDFISPYHIDSK
jgi:hypothetical protein